MLNREYPIKLRTVLLKKTSDIGLNSRSLKDIKVKDSENVKNQFAQERTSGMNSLLKWVNELPKLN